MTFHSITDERKMRRTWRNISYPVVLISLPHAETVAQQDASQHAQSHPDLGGNVVQLDEVLL